MEGPLTNGAISHIAHAKIFRFIIFFRESNTGAEGYLTTYNSMSAEEAAFFIKHMHRTTFTLGNPRLLSIQFGHNRLRISTEAERMAMIPVGGDPFIILGQCGNGPG